MLLCPELTCPGAGKHPLTRMYRPMMRTLGSEEQSDCSPLRGCNWALHVLLPSPSQGSSTAPQLESIDSLVLSLLQVQLSHLYMTTGNTIALTIQTFVSKVISLLSKLECSFKMLMGSCLPLLESLRLKPQFFPAVHRPCLLLPPFLPQPPSLLQPLWASSLFLQQPGPCPPQGAPAVPAACCLTGSLLGLLNYWFLQLRS